MSLVALLLYGQAFTSLSGIVTDPTGAVIPNATIVVTNIETGQTRESTADAQGRYAFPQLAPSTYKLVAKATGFNDVTIASLELLVNSPATVNISFEKLGTQTQTVQVEAAATQVNTQDASLGNAIGTQAIMELPFFARNVAGLLQFQPGVTSFGTSDDDRNGSVNGGKSDQSNVTLDGVDVNDQAGRAAFTSVLRVTLDSVQEFRTTTGNGGADTGRGSGADVALVTKNGTNEFHGSLYEYHRNTITAANSFFNNRSRVPRAPLLINVFGGSVGGPIKKNKAFFFLNYEGRRDRSSQNVSRTVPSDLLRQGIVQFNNTSGKLDQVGPDRIKNEVDPLHLGVNQNALKIFNAYPHSNDNSLGDGLNFVGYRFSAPVASDQNTYIARLDYTIDNSGKNQLFWRGNLQNDSANGTPQFPGQAPNSVNLNNSKGFAAGWTSLLRPNLVSTFRYGLTRYGAENSGVLASSYTSFRNLDSIYGTSTGFTQIIPTHSITQDFAWTKGAHDVRFGGTVRLIKNGTRDTSHSYNTAVTNASWLRGTGTDLIPSTVPVSSKDSLTYADAMVALLGIISQGRGNYNYLANGTTLAVGTPVTRHFNGEEYEMYGQDTWKIRRNLTITAGLRYSLNPPVYEANGQQISSDIPLEKFLNDRGGLAQQGKSQAGIGTLNYILADGPGGRPYYPYHKNWSPRVGLAYSPNSDSGIGKFLFGGPGKTSIRAGWGQYYDLIGQPLVATANATAFGLSTTLVNPAGQLTSATAPRFTDFYSVPAQVVRPAPKGGFPAPQPSSGAGSFAITNTIDDSLKAPYTMNMNFSIGREFAKGLFIQGSYVGRLSRHSLINRDMAMPTDLKDPKSGQTYFEAASQLQRLLFSGVKVKDLPKIPFFENMWAGAAAGGYTATQIWAKDTLENESIPDFTSTLADMDQYCDPGGTSFLKNGTVDTPGCGIYGPNMMFNPQFSALSAWSSIGGGSYHAMQWTVRKRFSDLLFDFNYTWSKSIDLASRAENAGSFTGFIVNSWNPGQRKAVSDYDTTHAANGYGVWQLPFGRGKKYGTNMNRVLDAFVGGWQISGTFRITSGLPVSPGNGRRWPTNWNITGNATPNGNPQPPVTNDKNAPAVSGSGGPNLWSDPKADIGAFGFTLAGQYGTRNTIRGDGFFDIDTGLYKRFTMPFSEKHTLQIRWETFNLTNSVRLDPGSANLSLTAASNWGKLTRQLGSPRQMQFALRYQF